MLRLLVDHGRFPGEFLALDDGEQLLVQALYLADSRQREERRRYGG